MKIYFKSRDSLLKGACFINQKIYYFEMFVTNLDFMINLFILKINLLIMEKSQSRPTVGALTGLDIFKHTLQFAIQIK